MTEFLAGLIVGIGGTVTVGGIWFVIMVARNMSR